MVPLTTPGGKNPVTDVPGLTPRSPLTTDGPVFVTDWPPRTATLCSVPSGTSVATACAAVGVSTRAKRASAPVSIAAIHTYAVRNGGESAFFVVIRGLLP